MRVLVFCVCRALRKKGGGLPTGGTARLLTHLRFVGDASCDSEGQERNCQYEATRRLQ